MDQQLIEQLVELELPLVASHLRTLSLSLSFVTSQWFLCMFLNSLPSETIFRIWVVDQGYKPVAPGTQGFGHAHPPDLTVFPLSGYKPCFGSANRELTAAYPPLASGLDVLPASVLVVPDVARSRGFDGSTVAPRHFRAG